jgi:hypothetical protein
MLLMRPTPISHARMYPLWPTQTDLGRKNAQNPPPPPSSLTAWPRLELKCGGPANSVKACTTGCNSFHFRIAYNLRQCLLVEYFVVPFWHIGQPVTWCLVWAQQLVHIQEGSTATKPGFPPDLPESWLYCMEGLGVWHKCWDSPTAETVPYCLTPSSSFMLMNTLERTLIVHQLLWERFQAWRQAPFTDTKWHQVG